MASVWIRQWRAFPERVKRRVALGGLAGATALTTVMGVAALAAGPAGAVLALGAGAAVLWAGAELFVPQWSRLSGAVWRGEIPERVALTFDDGPDPEVTPRLLALLAEHEARATFFVLGERVQASPGLAREILAAGHEIGLHGWSHQKVWHLGYRAFSREVGRGMAAVESATGFQPKWYRPPHGFLRPDQAWWLRRQGLRPAGWTIGVWDTDEHVTAEQIRDRVLASVEERDILLLHDGVADRNRPQLAMVAALRDVLEHWTAEGIRAVPLSHALVQAAPAARKTPEVVP